MNCQAAAFGNIFFASLCLLIEKEKEEKKGEIAGCSGGMHGPSWA